MNALVHHGFEVEPEAPHAPEARKLVEQLATKAITP
jgi:hypothetical protein